MPTPEHDNGKSDITKISCYQDNMKKTLVPHFFHKMLLTQFPLRRTLHDTIHLRQPEDNHQARVNQCYPVWAVRLCYNWLTQYCVTRQPSGETI